MNCPLCHSESEPAFEARGFRLLDCVKCRHRFAEIAADERHVAEVYGDDYFSGGGAGYADYAAEGEMLRARGAMYAKKLAKLGVRKGGMLDVGAAAGFILRGFIDAGWHGTGLEPSAGIAERGRTEFGLDIRTGTLETFETDEKFDLVSMIQVAGHLYAPRRAFENAAALLSENGYILIETWNRESFSAKLFGKNWHEYSPPSVLQWFSGEGLTNFLNDLGFEKVAAGRPAKKISGEHARSLLKYRLGDNFLLKLIPAKVNFPYPSEDLLWALYRKK